MAEPHPSEENIADYLRGFLPDDQKAEMETHFADCKICLDELITLKTIGLSAEADETDAVPEKVTSTAFTLIKNQNVAETPTISARIKQSAGQLLLEISDSLDDLFGISPRPASIRGANKIVSGDFIRLTLVFDEIEAAVEIEKIGGQRVNIRVTLVKGIEQGVKTRVSLQKDERDLVSYLMDKNNDTVFKEILYGRYAMVFRRNGQVAGIYPFEIKETSHDR